MTEDNEHPIYHGVYSLGGIQVIVETKSEYTEGGFGCLCHYREIGKERNKVPLTNCLHYSHFNEKNFLRHGAGDELLSPKQIERRNQDERNAKFKACRLYC